MSDRGSHNRARLALWIAAALLLGSSVSHLVLSDGPQKLDPAAWGADHVGQPVPEFASGDQCLFCHREKVGASWSVNRHNATIRAIDERSPALEALKGSPAKDFAGEIRFL